MGLEDIGRANISGEIGKLADFIGNIKTQARADRTAQLNELKFAQESKVTDINLQKAENELALQNQEIEQGNKVINITTLPQYKNARPELRDSFVNFAIKNGYIDTNLSGSVKNLAKAEQIFMSQEKFFGASGDRAIQGIKNDIAKVSKDISELEQNAIGKDKDLSKDKKYITLTKQRKIMEDELNHISAGLVAHRRKLKELKAGKKGRGSVAAAVQKFNLLRSIGKSIDEAISIAFKTSGLTPKDILGFIGSLGKSGLYDEAEIEKITKSSIASAQKLSGQNSTVPTGQELDDETARKILDEAGGDKDKARKLAKERGYTF